MSPLNAIAKGKHGLVALFDGLAICESLTFTNCRAMEQGNQTLKAVGSERSAYLLNPVPIPFSRDDVLKQRCACKEQLKKVQTEHGRSRLWLVLQLRKQSADNMATVDASRGLPETPPLQTYEVWECCGRIWVRPRSLPTPVAKEDWDQARADALQLAAVDQALARKFPD
eukprot:symbB.v1.2.009604.t1/scaffold613.1/size180894/12